MAPIALAAAAPRQTPFVTRQTIRDNSDPLPSKANWYARPTPGETIQSTDQSTIPVALCTTAEASRHGCRVQRPRSRWLVSAVTIATPYPQQLEAQINTPTDRASRQADSLNANPAAVVCSLLIAPQPVKPPPVMQPDVPPRSGRKSFVHRHLPAPRSCCRVIGCFRLALMRRTPKPAGRCGRCVLHDQPAGKRGRRVASAKPRSGQAGLAVLRSVLAI